MHKLVIGLILLVVFGIGGMWYYQSNASASTPRDAGSNGAVSEDPETATATQDQAPAKTKQPGLDPYKEATADSSNPRVQSVIEAQRTGKYPERLNVDSEPKPFNKAAFEANPNAYLNIVEPGRIYQTLPPQKGAPRLEYKGKNPIPVAPAGEIEIKVQALPKAPVSFYASNGGIFRESTLNSITVQADDKGVASVTYYANPGTFGIAPVIVGSPYLAGNAEIMVSVRNAVSKENP